MQAAEIFVLSLNLLAFLLMMFMTNLSPGQKISRPGESTYHAGNYGRQCRHLVRNENLAA